MREAFFFFLIVIGGTAGEICVTRAVRSAGEIGGFRPALILCFVKRALGNRWMFIGVSLMTIAFFSLLAVLSFENVSFVVPVSALSYAAGTGGAVVFLHERVTRRRWLGVLLVCAGVTIVWLSRM
jgi:drug/metabolite transporter (DMT)-like permease